jgi:hypothetical protein
MNDYASSSFPYRAAVSLNNSAISMVERAMFTEALETQNEAVHIMSSTCSGAGDDLEKEVISIERICSRLEHARRQLSSPISSPVNLVAFRLQVVQHTQADSKSNSKEKAPLHSLIRIEDSDEELLQQQVDIPIAIMVHNLGIANAMCGHLDEGIAFLTKALIYLRAMLPLSAALGDPYTMIRVVFFYKMALSTLGPALESSGQWQEAAKAAAEFNILCQLATSLEEMGVFMNNFELASPAA